LLTALHTAQVRREAAYSGQTAQKGQDADVVHRLQGDNHVY
jgi:hypothetical protein